MGRFYGRADGVLREKPEKRGYEWDDNEGADRILSDMISVVDERSTRMIEY